VVSYRRFVRVPRCQHGHGSLIIHGMKRAKLLHSPPASPKVRNPVARSPLLGKGGPHGKTNAAKRRQANIELVKLQRAANSDE
jgi:hypothetical protein